MANYTITVSSESEYVGPPLYVMYSTSMHPNITMSVGDTLTITYNKYAGGQPSVTINNWDSGLWDDTSSIVLNDGESVVRTAIAAGSDQIVADFPHSSFPDRNRIVTIESTVIVEPDTAITQNPSGSITTSNSTFTKSITNANSNNVTDYRLLRTTGTDTVYDTYTGTATSFTLTGDMPTSGSWTYVIQARVPTANNGDNAWKDVGSAFTVNRSTTATAGGGGTTYNISGSTTDKTKNIYNDDVINLSYLVDIGDRGYSWSITTEDCSASETSGYFYPSHPAVTTFMAALTNFTGSTYSAEFFVGTTSKFTVSGTVSDPYVITNVTFPSVTGKNPGATNVESAERTFNVARSGEVLDFSVSNGELEKNNSNTWASSGTITDGDTYRLRRNASTSYSTTVSCTVTFSKNSVNKRSETFSITTRAQDVTPNAYNLGGPAYFKNVSSYNYSNTITVAGMDSDASCAVSISGTGAAYSKNGTAYTTSAGTVENGDTLRVRLQAPSTVDSSRTATLNVGGVADTYKVTTDISFSLGANETKDPSAYEYRSFVVDSDAYASPITFSGTNCAVSTDNNTWTSSITRSDGQTVYVRIQAGANYNDTVTATVGGGGTSDSVVITTRAQDTTPDSFSFTDVTGANRSSTVTAADTITIAGMDSDSSVTASISGSTGKQFRWRSSSSGTWSAWQSTNKTGVSNGYQFQVRVTASSSFDTGTSATLTVGGRSDTFNVQSEVAVSPDTSVTFSTNTPLFADTSFTLSTSGTGSTTTYQVRTGSYTGTVIKTFTGAASNLNIANQPSTSGTTYYVTGYVSDANDGTEDVSNVGTFSVTRSSEVTPDTSITVSPSGHHTVSNTTFSVSVTNANSNSVTDYRLVVSGTTTALDSYTSTGTSFSLETTSPSTGSSEDYVIQARVPTANNGNGSWTNAHSFTVTRASVSSVGGATYTYSHSSTSYAQRNKNVFNDDKIALNWTPASGDLNNSWAVNEVTGAALVSESPASGYFHAGHYYAMNSEVTFTSTGSYDIIYHIGSYNTSNRRVRFYGTVTDPYGVTNINFSSKSVTPGNGTTTTESVAQTFDTFREGETLDYSVTGGELYNGVAWGTSGTVADGASLKLRGVTPAVYSGSQTVTVTFSKNSVTKRTESFVINTPALTAPTDITFVNDGDNSATEQVTVTASGGTSGTIKVSNDGTNWYDNGTKFDHTRGTGVAYYARREGVNSLTSSNYTEAHAVSCITPTNLTFVNDGDASATEDVTVTASGGYGGTLEVSSDGSTWHANGTKFDQSRNTSVTYYARRKATYSSSNYTEDHSVSYLAPLAYSYTVSGSNPLNYSDSGFNVAISGADANHTYRVLHDGANAGTRTTDGNIAVQFSELPSPGAQKTYTVQAVRTTDTGGSGSYVTKSTFIRSVRPSTPTVTTSTAATEASLANVTVTASSTGATEYRFSNDGTTYTDWGTSTSHIFEDQSRGTSYTYSVQSRSAIVESLVGSSTITVPYLAPKAFSYSVSDSDPLAYNDGGFNVTIAGADTNHSYQVLHNGSNAGTRTTNGNILISGSELPSAGSIKTYTVRALRNTNIGGSGSYVNISTFTRSMRPSNPTLSSSSFGSDASATTSRTITASSTGATEYRFKISPADNSSGVFSAWQSSSSFTFDVATYGIGRGDSVTTVVEARSSNANASGNLTLTQTVPYLAPNTSVTIPSTAYTVGSNTTTQDIVITGVGNNETVRITGEDSVTAAAKGNATLTVNTPTSGSVGTYQIEIQRDTASGGNGTTWYDTNKSFTITRGSNATPVIDLFIPAPSSTVGEETVTLSATGITDSDGTISTITITQVSGTNVTLANVTTTGTGTASATASTTFTSPNEAGSLVFRVTATDDDAGTSTKDVLVTTSESSVVAPPTEGLYGLEVYGPNEELYLSVTDKLVIFLDNLVGYLPQNTQSIDITIVGNPTNVIWLNAPAALSLASLNFALNGNILTISRASASTTSIYYEVLVLGE